MPDGSLCKLTEARTRCARRELANAQSHLSSARLAACAELVKADPLPDQGASSSTAENLPPANRLAFCRERVFAHMELQTIGHSDYDAEAAAIDDLRFHREKLSVASTKPEFKTISDSFSAAEALQASIQSLQTMVLNGFRDQREAAKADAAALKTELKSDIAGLRRELKGDIAGLRRELKDDIAGLTREVKEDVALLKNNVALLRKDVDGLTVKVNVLGARLTNSMARCDDALEKVQNAKGEYPPQDSFPATWNELRMLSDGAVVDILGHYEPEPDRRAASGASVSESSGGHEDVTSSRSAVGRRGRMSRAASAARNSWQHRRGVPAASDLAEEERARKRRRLHQMLGASPDIAVTANWTWTP